MTNLRDSSQDTHFSMIKTVVRHSAIYGFFDMLGKATALVLLPLYARALTPADYGTLEIFTVTGTALLTPLLLLGFQSALVRYYATARSPEEGRDYFRTALTTVLGTSFAAWLVLFLAAPALSRLFFGQASMTWHWRTVFSAVLVDAAGYMILALFRSQERPVRYSSVTLTRFGILMGTNVILVGVLGMGVKGALIGNLAGAVAGLGLGVLLALREVGIGFSLPRFRQLAGFGLPLVVNAVAVTFVMGRADRYFLKALGTLSDVGVYALGYKIAMILSVLVNAFMVAWFPIIFRIAREPDAKAIFSRVLTYYLLATGFVAVAISSYASEIVDLVAKPEYERAASVVLLILGAYLFQGIYTIMTAGVSLTDRTRWMSLVAAVSAAVNLGANLVLVPAYGIHGAAWAALGSYAFLAAAMGAVSRRYYPIPVERRVALLAGVTAAVLVMNLSVLGHGTAVRALAKVLPLVLFPVLLRVTGFFSREERIRAREWVGRTLGGGRASVS